MVTRSQVQEKSSDYDRESSFLCGLAQAQSCSNFDEDQVLSSSKTKVKGVKGLTSSGTRLKKTSLDLCPNGSKKVKPFQLQFKYILVVFQ